jgi:8-oxo-dGTP pyrophosphatase MutT (NUDIX family)
MCKFEEHDTSDANSIRNARPTSTISARVDRETHCPASILLAKTARGGAFRPGCCPDPNLRTTQRTHKVETHKGQISFPGGIQDDSDRDLLETALRETWEEIGLARQAIRVLGEFDEYLSITALVVTPFVAWLQTPPSLAPNPDEVDEILEVPFSVFRDARLLRVEKRVRQGVERKVYFYDFLGKEVWGLTGQIIRDLLQLLDSP